MLRLPEALDHFKPGLGDVAMVLAFTGLRWEEAVGGPDQNVDLDRSVDHGGPDGERVGR